MYLKNNWFHFTIENPLGTWWKARKYFKRPKISFHISKVTTYSGYPYICYKHISKILDVDIHDVWWKDKWNSPRHERNPLIWICLFRKIALCVNFNIYYKDEFDEKVDGDLYYWEYLLKWLYYKKKKTLRCYSAWSHDSRLYREVKYGKAEDGSEDIIKPFMCVVPTVAMSLNKQGIKELKLELNKK